MSGLANGDQDVSRLTSEVFITGELKDRTPKKIDYFREKLALQDLATRMADGPEEVLPRFVELAVEMTGGISAGLSLYEEEPAPGVFRWSNVCGTLAAFNGATTPRNDSPCGVTLDIAAPVLTRHSERLYKWIADANIVLPEVLLVPLFIGQAEPLGTLWIVSDQEPYFDSAHARIATELAAFVGIALRMQKTEEHLRAALKSQELITREMNHRLKNVFAITDSLVRFTAKGAATKDDMARTLSGRLQALASAHALVLPGIAGSEKSSPPDLRTMLELILRPHENGAEGFTRFSLNGPVLAVNARAVPGLALVIHELATNAAKYGALTKDAGHVDISWRIEDHTLVIRWTETDGPPVAAPAHVGFGTKLVESTVVGEFRGALNYEWNSGGLVLNIAIPLDRLH